MLSVVIPTLNAGPNLPKLLEQLSGTVDEVVISDGGSCDKTLDIALSFPARLALGCKGRGWQLSRGAKWAHGDWLLFLHADTRLGEGWLDAVNAHIQAHANRAGYFIFKLDDKGWRPRLMERIVSLRCRVWQLPYGDQGLLISRHLYEDIGGFPDWELFEDVKIIEALRGCLRRLNANIYTNADRYKKQGYWSRAANNFRLYRKYKKGVNIDILTQDYYT